MSASRRLIELGEQIQTREAEEARKRERGEGTSPLTIAAQGGKFATSGTHPWGFLTDEDLEELAEVSDLLSWGEDAQQHLRPVERRDAVEGALSVLIEEEVKDEGKAEQVLRERRERLESVIGEHEFLIPVDNLYVARDLEITIGEVSIEALPEDAWMRFCAEAWADAKSRYENVPDNDAGRLVANRLIGADALRPALQEDELPPGILRVHAYGSPSSAYKRAREDAHFALACVTFFNRPWDEQAGRHLALEGEQQARENGWRARFATDEVPPEIFSDGRGPSVPIHLEGLDQETIRFYQELNQTATAPSDYGDRLLRAIHWMGSTLNTPVLVDDPDQEHDPGVSEGSPKPTAFEVCERLTSLITALEAVLKQHGENRYDVLPRAEQLLESLDPTPSAVDLRDALDNAYTARNDCAHEGHGDPTREHIESVRGVLQILVPRLVLVCDQHLGTFADLERLCNNVQQGERWEKTLQRTAIP